MAVDALTGATSSAAGRASASGGLDKTMGLSTDAFYKLLIAEMRYQDPMEPMDNAKMVEQVAGIRSIEASTAMTKTLETVTRQQNYSTAASLIGKQVTGILKDYSGNEVAVSGVVTQVTFGANGQVVLELDDGAARLPLEAVVQVQNPVQAEPEPEQPTEE
jgi:flagellar basal-body rod modification protein FlgD